VFSATIGRLDLRQVTFKQAEFENVTWANCRFDQTTTFTDCGFQGGSLLYCEGFGQFLQCQLDTGFPEIPNSNYTYVHVN
jgi:uncharacterized protein YjbI with pentapeptide repeats